MHLLVVPCHECWIICADTRKSVVATAWVVAIKVTIRRYAEAGGVHQPMVHHGFRLFLTCSSNQQWIEACRANSVRERAIGKPICKYLLIGIPQFTANFVSHGIASSPKSHSNVRIHSNASTNSANDPTQSCSGERVLDRRPRPHIFPSRPMYSWANPTDNQCAVNNHSFSTTVAFVEVGVRGDQKSRAKIVERSPVSWPGRPCWKVARCRS